MIPGEITTAPGDIELNKGRKTVTLAVANSGDRPIQVGSHYHFFETNPALKFERKKAAACGSTSRPGRRCGSSRADARGDARGARGQARGLWVSRDVMGKL